MRRRPTLPTTTISSRSTCRRRSRSPRSGRSRRRCSTRTAPPARAALSAGGTACGWRRLRPPTKRLAKRAMKRARRCLARLRTRQRTMPAPTSPRSAGVDEALLRRGPTTQQQGRGHRRLRQGPAPPTTRQRTSLAQPRPHPAGNVGEDFHRSTEARPAGNETEASPAPPRPRPAANEAAPHRKQGRVVHGRWLLLWSQEGHRSSTQSTPSLVG